jgi:hypothetical protein
MSPIFKDCYLFGGLPASKTYRGCIRKLKSYRAYLSSIKPPQRTLPMGIIVNACLRNKQNKKKRKQRRETKRITVIFL